MLSVISGRVPLHPHDLNAVTFIVGLQAVMTGWRCLDQWLAVPTVLAEAERGWRVGALGEAGHRSRLARCQLSTTAAADPRAGARSCLAPVAPSLAARAVDRGVLLLVFGSRVGLIAMPHNVRSVLWAAALLVIGLHLWLAQRAARVAILGEVKRLARESTVRAER